MNDFDKKLDFDSNTFEDMKRDMNFVLQRLLGNMIEKQSNEGSMTIKIDVTMVKEFIPNYDPNIKGESREISNPQFKHKVTSAVKITDEKGGNLNNEMEMVMDEETGCYVLQPIANTQQRTIFDSDFMQGQEQEGSVLVSYPKMRIEGTVVNLGDAHIMLPDCRIISIEELKKIERGGVK